MIRTALASELVDEYLRHRGEKRRPRWNLWSYLYVTVEVDLGGEDLICEFVDWKAAFGRKFSKIGKEGEGPLGLGSVIHQTG